MSKTLQEVLLLMQIIGHIWSTFYFLNLFWTAISKYTIPKYSSSWSHHTICQLTLLFLSIISVPFSSALRLREREEKVNTYVFHCFSPTN